ncbi:O-unit flippase-like protein [Butyrivibrio sp. XPD2006]|uniref:O-unit flippase-like protein n=1 Tax=Butyrivibrio sp. XPD2006 TaxID=1280668 RepID=UPI0003B3A705|nr:O-unit flippase-like protein [Butyrivibrio sp. XPD2006]
MRVSKKDLVWTYLAKFFSLGVNVIILPLILWYLSDEELGLWYVFAGISQMVNLLDFGFSATISRHMAYAWSGAKEIIRYGVSSSDNEEKNWELISEVIKTSKSIYLLVALLAVLIMSVGGTLYVYRVSGWNLENNVKLAWGIYIFAVAINILFAYCTSLLNGIGAVAEKNKVAVCSKTVQIVVAFILLSNGIGLLGFVISYAVSGVTLRIVGMLYFSRRVDKRNLVAVRLGRVYEQFRVVWATAWKDGIVTLSNFFSTQMGTLMCAYYIDLKSTGSYGVLTQIFMTIGAMASAYYAAYQPKYCNLVVSGKDNEVRELTCKGLLIYKILFVLLSLLFIFVGLPVLHVLRPQMSINFYYVLLLGIFYYLYMQNSTACSMISCNNIIPYYGSYVITAVLSVTLSYLFAVKLDFGILGLILGQLISNLIFNSWFWLRYLLKRLKIAYSEIYTIGWNEIKKVEKL